MQRHSESNEHGRQAMVKYVVGRKPIGWFKEGRNTRKHRVEAALRQMGKSLRVRQIHPALARSDGTTLDGWSRVLAAGLEGLAELDVIITDEELTESDIGIIQWVSAEHRSGLTDGEKWRGACELMQMNTHWTPKDLGEALGLEPHNVTVLLSPCKLIAAAQDALTEGKIGLSVSYAISKAKDDAEQAELLALHFAGATRDELDRVRKNSQSVSPKSKKKKKLKPASRIKRFKFGTPNLSIMVSGTECSLKDLAVALHEIAEGAEQAEAKGWDAVTYEMVYRKGGAVQP
jgi:ParB-like chromosome segregation protein Spo0J